MNITKFAVNQGILIIIVFSAGCNGNGNAQESETDFSTSFSGSFITQTINTDTDEDGRPATLGTLEGDSSLGKINIQNVIEFALLGESAECPVEFLLARGNFILRIEGTGDLVFGEWTSGTSCFDPVTGITERTLEGVFTGGTGDYANISGPIQQTANAILLTTTAEQGYAFGGSTGTMSGTIMFGSN